MTTMVDPASDGAVAIAVELTLRQHESRLRTSDEEDGEPVWESGTCRQCQPDGACRQLDWARREQDRLRGSRTGPNLRPTPHGR